VKIKITKPIKLIIAIFALALTYRWYGWRAVIIFILFGIDTGEWE